MDDDSLGSATDQELTDAAALVDQLSVVIGKITEVTRDVTALNTSTTAKLNAATGAGRQNPLDLVDELAAAYADPNERMIGFTEQFEAGVSQVDAAMTKVLDGLEDHTSVPAVRAFLRSVATLGGEAEVFVAQVRAGVVGLKDLRGPHAGLTEAVDLRASSLERVIASCESLVALGARARAIGPFKN